jgi:hypothetical protein
MLALAIAGCDGVCFMLPGLMFCQEAGDEAQQMGEKAAF